MAAELVTEADLEALCRETGVELDLVSLTEWASARAAELIAQLDESGVGQSLRALLDEELGSSRDRSGREPAEVEAEAEAEEFLSPEDSGVELEMDIDEDDEDEQKLQNLQDVV